MRFRRYGRLAVLLAGWSAGSRMFSQAPAGDLSRPTAWKLAQNAIRDTGPRPGIPDFVTWLTAREIYPCQTPSSGAPRLKAVRDLLDESFHYNAAAAARMCGPLTAAPGAPPMDRALEFWERSHPRPATIDPLFPSGAELSAAFWNAVRLPADPAQGKIVELPVRSGTQTSFRRIRITIPQRVRAASSACGPPQSQGAPASTGVEDVSLDDFFWVQLAPGERYNGGTCGDFA